MERQVFLNDVGNIKNFVNDVSRLNANVNVSHDNYNVDGKSLLGILSLDLSNTVKVSIDTTNTDIICEFNNICDKYASEV